MPKSRNAGSPSTSRGRSASPGGRSRSPSATPASATERRPSRPGSPGGSHQPTEAHTNGQVGAATRGQVAVRPNPESGEQQAATPEHTPPAIKPEYTERSEQDRMASMAMSAVYSSEHIEVTMLLQVPHQKSANKVAAERLELAKARRKEVIEEYKKDYPNARVLYDAYGPPTIDPNPDPNKKPPQPKDVSQINWDTAAVMEHGGTLYVAMNYKARQKPEESNSIQVDATYASVGRVSQSAQDHLKSMLEKELEGHPRIQKVTVLHIDPLPSTEEENAKPHAEMQLVQHLQKAGVIKGKEHNQEAGFKVGVSKACCKKCADKLDELGIQRPDWQSSSQKSNLDPVNWSDPSIISTGVLTSFSIPRAADPLQHRPIQADNPECEAEGHPVAPATGESFDHFVDHEEPGELLFRWIRHYRSGESDRRGPVGRGFRHSYERSLTLDYARAIYTDDRGRDVELFLPRPGEPDSHAQGYTLRTEQEGERLTCFLSRVGEPTMEFVEERRGAPVRFAGLRAGKSRMELRHDARGRLIGMMETSETGTIETRLSLDSEGRIYEVRRGSSKGSDLPVIAAYTYDENGCLTRARDAAGAECLYSHDAAGRMTSSTDRNGYTFHYRYDEQGRCVETWGEDGLYGVELHYDPRARRTTTIRSSGAVWTYEYDVNNTIVRVTDPYGGVRRREPDASGRIVREMGPGKRTLRFLHDEAGGNSGVVDRFGYIHPPLDVEPNPEDPLTDKIPATPWEQQWGPVIESLTPTEMPVDGVPAGDVSPTVRRDRTVEERDKLHRPTVESDVAGHRSTLTYDPAGNVTAYLDRDGREHAHQIASWNLIAAVIDPLGHSTRYGYTTGGSIARISDAGGSESRYEYDQKERLVRVYRHGALREEYIYDLGDSLIEKRGRDGRPLLRCVTADNGLPAERVLASGDVQQLRYDAHGEVVWARASGAEITRAFDGKRRLVQDERDGLGVRTAYRGDQGSRTTYLGRFIAQHRLREDGSLTIKDPTGGVHRVRRREPGLITASLGNGTTVRSTYDHEGRCLSREVRSSAGVARRILSYSYSAEGELRRVEDSLLGATTHLYDAAHRLIGAEGRGAMSIRLDPAGNVLDKPGLSRAELLEGNRLRASGRERFRYDNRDRLAEIAVTTGESTRFEYDSLDRLVRVTSRPSEADRRSRAREEPPAWTAAYDGLCRRMYKATGDRRVEFYWEGDRLAAEIGPTGAVRIYVYPAPGALVPLLFIDYESVESHPASGRVYYPIGDQVGVPLFIEDQDGQVVWSASHVEPHGAVTVSPEARIAYNLRFPGHYHDEETGLHENRYRSYSPRLGRYLQPDPAGQSGGTNLYAYPANPLVEVDVLGRTPNHLRRTGESTGGAAEKPGLLSRALDKLRPSRKAATVPVEPPRPPKPTDDDLMDYKAQVEDLVRQNPQIHVIWDSLSMEYKDLWKEIRKYLQGDLVVYRGIQQCHPVFTKGWLGDEAEMASPDNPLLMMNPKKPESTALPDFTTNDNAWLPMGTTFELSMHIALSWSHSIVGYFKGGMDANRPVAIIYEKRVSPDEPIAFCMEGEIQLKGPLKADRATYVTIDTPLKSIDSRRKEGETFRTLAVQAGVPIIATAPEPAAPAAQEPE